MEENSGAELNRFERKRWLILAIVSLINMSAAMVWLCFSPVAYKVASYYNADLIVINTLSLVYMAIAIPCGILVIWVMDKYGLRVCILICAWSTCVGSLIRICSTVEGLDDRGKLVILFFGQVVAALGSPFGLYTPAKVAGSWFPDRQRTIANTIAASANPVGIIITGLLSPQFQESDGYFNMRCMLITYAVPCIAAAILSTIYVTSDGPKVSPSYVDQVSKSAIKGWAGVEKVMSNKMYVLLMFCLGTGIGLYSSFATLMEQVLCPWGYTDKMAGACATILTASGIFGAVLISTVVDRTKKFSETLKSVYFLTTFGVIILAFTHHIYLGYWILIEVAIVGFFAFAIYPIGTEIAAECTYPVGAGTSTGLIQLSGQLQSILLVLLLSSIGHPMPADDVIQNNSKCHQNNTANGQNDHEVTYDMRISVYVCSCLMTFSSIMLAWFFRPTYRRMEEEKQQQRNIEIQRHRNNTVKIVPVAKEQSKGNRDIAQYCDGEYHHAIATDDFSFSDKSEKRKLMFTKI